MPRSLVVVLLLLPVAACGTSHSYATFDDVARLGLPRQSAALPMSGAGAARGGDRATDERTTTASPDILASVPKTPQSGDPALEGAPYRDTGGVAIGVGTTFDPSTFLIGAALDLPAGGDVYWGPAIHVGITDSRTLVAGFLQGKYVFGDDGSDRPRIAPFLQSGLGFVYYDVDGAGDEASLLLNFGGGVRFDLSSRLKLGSTLLVNWAPNEILDERVYVSWEILQLVIPF